MDGSLRAYVAVGAGLSLGMPAVQYTRILGSKRMLSKFRNQDAVDL